MLSVEQTVLFGILVGLLLWYTAGAWYNRRRGFQTGQWLSQALGLFGGQLAWKWVGTASSGARITIENALRPFEKVQIIFAMTTREILPLWILEKIRRRGDVLAIHADLRKAPAQEIEVLPLHGSLKKSLDAASAGRPWNWEEAPYGFGIGTRDPETELVARVRTFVGEYGAHLQRLSLRPDRKSHLVVFMALEHMQERPAGQLIHALKDVALPVRAAARCPGG